MPLSVNNLPLAQPNQSSTTQRLIKILGEKLPGSERFQNEQQSVDDYLELVIGQEPSMKKPLREWIKTMLSLWQGNMSREEVQKLLDPERMSKDIGKSNTILILSRGAQISLLIAKHRVGKEKIFSAGIAKSFIDALAKFNDTTEFNKNIAQLEKLNFNLWDVSPEFLERIQSEARWAFAKKVGIVALGVVGTLGAIYGLYWAFSESKELPAVQPAGGNEGKKILENVRKIEVPVVLQKAKEAVIEKVDGVIEKIQQVKEQVKEQVQQAKEQVQEVIVGSDVEDSGAYDMRSQVLEKISENGLFIGLAIVLSMVVYRKCFSKADRNLKKPLEEDKKLITIPKEKKFFAIANVSSEDKHRWYCDILSSIKSPSNFSGVNLSELSVEDCEKSPLDIINEASGRDQRYLDLAEDTLLGRHYFPRSALMIFQSLIRTAAFREFNFEQKDVTPLSRDEESFAIAEILWQLKEAGCEKRMLTEWVASRLVDSPSETYIAGLEYFIDNADQVRNVCGWTDKKMDAGHNVTGEGLDWSRAREKLHQQAPWLSSLCVSIDKQCETFVPVLLENHPPQRHTIIERAADIVTKVPSQGLKLTLQEASLINLDHRKIAARAYWLIFNELVDSFKFFQNLPAVPEDDKEETLAACNRTLIRKVPVEFKELFNQVMNTLWIMQEHLTAKGRSHWLVDELLRQGIIPREPALWKTSFQYLLDNKVVILSSINEKPVEKIEPGTNEKLVEKIESGTNEKSTEKLQIESGVDVQKLMGRTFQNEIESNIWKCAVLEEFVKYFANEEICKTPDLIVSEEKKKDQAFIQRVEAFLQQIGQIEIEGADLSESKFSMIPDEFAKSDPETPLVVSHAFQLFMQANNSLAWSENNMFGDLDAFSKEDPENRKTAAPKILGKLDKNSMVVLQLFVKVSQAIVKGQQAEKAVVEKLTLLFGDKKELREFLCFLIEQLNVEDLFKAPDQAVNGTLVNV